MVGPNFHSPAAPKVKQYNESTLPKKTVNIAGDALSNKTQAFKLGEDISHEWWKLFHSKAINKLVSAGIKNSPTLASAYAALRKSEELLKAQIGSTLLPSISTQNFKERQQLAETTYASAQGSDTFNVYYSVFNLSYTVDVFGGIRREIEAFKAEVNYKRFELIAAYLNLTSTIVTTSINIASLDAQIKATQNLVNYQQNLLKILTKQFQLGGIAKVEVLIQQTLLDQTKATVPPLQKNLSISKHALSTLIGAFPDKGLPTIKLEALNLPSHLPISLPSSLVRQRPDVRALEALLHSASAKIGVATANLLPTFTITGTLGFTSNVATNLYNNANRIWNLIMQAGQPIFNGGALFAKRRATIDAYKETMAQYRQTVLQAFKDVADALRSLDIDAHSLKAETRAENSASQSLELANSRYLLGAVNYIELLDAQKQYEQTVIALIKAKATRYNDTVSLFAALGGGWWNNDELKVKSNELEKL